MHERKSVDDVKFETYMQKENTSDKKEKKEDEVFTGENAPMLYLDVNLGNN